RWARECQVAPGFRSTQITEGERSHAPPACAGRLSASAAQARVRLELADHGHEVVEPDDPLELEAGTVVGGPDAVSFDPADHRQPDDHPVTTSESRSAFFGGVDHEAVRRNVADVELHVAAHPVLA